MVMDLQQGPGPPWCVGSILSSPQIVTSSSSTKLGPLIFDGVGNTYNVMSTGYVSQLSDIQIHHPKEQLSFLFESPTRQFLPERIVEELLQDDAECKLAMCVNSNQYFGNRLQGRKCRDGRMQLFFPTGKLGDRVASVICHRDEKQRLSFLGLCAQKGFQPSEVDIFCSSPLSHPILQLSAVEDDTFQKDMDVVLAARTSYQLQVFNVMSEEEKTFVSTLATNFQKSTSHVTWNPHFQGEVAVALEGGEVQLFDIELHGRNGGSLKAGSASNHSSCNCQLKYSGEFNFYTKSGQSDYLERDWWRCEYAWHPRTLLLAGRQEIKLLDFRTKTGSLDIPKPYKFASLKDMNCRSNFCHQPQHGMDYFVALTRANYDGMYQFAVASRKHLFLFDARQPSCPVVQWEHRMRHDPPGLLFMCPLFGLRGSLGSKYNEASSAGRVILAASFLSGHLQAFCYGPQQLGHIQEFAANGSAKRQNSLRDQICAWELPSKMLAAKADPDCWEDHLYTSLGLLGSGRRDLQCGGTPQLSGNQRLENIAGLVIVPNTVQKRNKEPSVSVNKIDEGFELLQLTGAGDILCQSFTASKSLCRSNDPLFKDSTFSSFVTSRKYAAIAKRLRFQDLQNLFRYIHMGRSPSTYHRNHVWSFIFDQDNESPKQDLCSDKAATEQQSKVAERQTSNDCMYTEINRGFNQAFITEILKQINSPLSIYEIAMKALWRTVPPNFVHSFSRARTMESRPGDESQKFLSPSDNELCVEIIEEQSCQCRLPITSAQKPVIPIPLPFILALNNSILPTEVLESDIFSARMRFQAGNGIGPTHLADFYNQVNEVLAHINCTEDSESDHDVISLDDPCEPWKTCLEEVLPKRESHTLMFKLPETSKLRPGARTVIGREEDSLAEVDRFCNFFGKGMSNETAAISPSNTSLCPFEMPFKVPGEELQADEVDAIMNLEKDFKRWQQSFTPYQKYCDANIHRLLEEESNGPRNEGKNQ